MKAGRWGRDLFVFLFLIFNNRKRKEEILCPINVSLFPIFPPHVPSSFSFVFLFSKKKKEKEDTGTAVGPRDGLEAVFNGLNIRNSFWSHSPGFTLHLFSLHFYFIWKWRKRWRISRTVSPSPDQRKERKEKEEKEGRDRRNHRSITKKRKGKEMTLRWVPSCRVLPSFLSFSLFLSSFPSVGLFLRS